MAGTKSEPPEVAPRDPVGGEDQVDDFEIIKILAKGKPEIEVEPEPEPIPRAESPAVPPPTYRWEEIRRQKMAGLYPWTYLYKEPLDELNGNLSDHDYEPISPPHARAVVPALSVTDIEGVTMQEPPEGPDSEPIMSDDSSGSPTRAAPVDVNVRVPYDGEEEVRTMGEDSDHDLDPDLGRDENLGQDGDLEENILTAQQYQDQMEAQFFSVPSVVSTPSTAPAGGFPVESQSAESQLDSSQPSQGSSGLPQRLRTQAGRLKTKLRSINRPKLPTIPRPKKPNISFPKLSRSKNQIKEANPSSCDSDKEATSPESSKENQSPKQRHVSSDSTSGSTKHIFNFSTVPRVFSRKPKRPKSARSTTPPAIPEVESSLDSAPRRKSIGQRWIEKVRDLHFADEDPEEKRRREQEREQRREKELHDRYLKQRERRESKEREKEQKELERIRKENEKYAKRLSVDVTHTIKPVQGKKTKGEEMVYHVSLHGSDSEPDYSDDPFPGPPYPELSEDDLGLALLTKPRSEGPSRSQSALDVDNSLRDYSRDHSAEPDTGLDTPASPGDSDRENRSSGTSSERHRRGVLEEIDSDEFFLRQKGISQEDVEMGRFISSEIRDALRAPAGTRDWSRIEYADDEDDEEEIEERYPTKPEHSTVKTVQSSTQPPSRPFRARILRPWRQGRKIPPTPPGDEPEEDEDEEEEPIQETKIDPSSYYKTFPPSRPQRTGKAKQQPAEEEPDVQLEDELVLHQEFEDIGSENEAPEVQRRLNESVAIFSEDLGILAPTAPARKEPPPRPQPPKRLRKSMTSLERDRTDESLVKDDWQSKITSQEHEVLALQVEVDYIIPPAQEPPVPPARRRPRSRATSQADEDRTSRGAESLPSERDIDIVDIDVVDIDGHIINDKANNRGQLADSYALVTKQQPQQRPRRTRSAKNLAAPGRRKRNQQSRFHNWRQFFSLPRRSKTTTTTTTVEPPVRPMRNYSTLGPARPPRRNSRHSREYLYVEDEIQHKTEPEIEPEAQAESAKDLQSSKITLKMKDRPLPAPPRPPRRAPESDEEECRQVILLDHVPDDVPERRLSREEHVVALAALRDDFFSRSRETPPPESPPVPRSPTGEELEPVFEPPYKSLRKKKRMPPVPFEVEGASCEVKSTSGLVDASLESKVSPEEVSIAIQTDPLPDEFCVEESIHQDEQSVSQFEPTTETMTTESWPTVVEVDAAIAEALPSMTTSTTGKNTEVNIAPPPIPPRLHVSDLDVSRLNVSELQAHRLTVSEIDSATLSTAEFSAQAGSLSLASGELSHTLAQAVADAVQSALSGVNEALSRPLEVVQQQHELQQQMRELQELQQLHQQQSEQSQQLVLQQLQAQIQQLAVADSIPPPVPPPPPSYSIQTQTSLAEAPAPPPVNPSYSIQTQTSLAEAPSPPQLPSSSIETQTSLAKFSAPPVPPSLTESELQSLSVSSGTPPPPPRRIRTPAPAESEDSEEIPSRSPPSSRRRRTHSSHSSSQPTEEPDLSAAGRQLAIACRTSLVRALNTLYSSIEPTLTAALSNGEANAKRRELQAALCLVLIVAAAMVILSCGCMSNKVQHHHWDFHLPPPL